MKVVGTTSIDYKCYSYPNLSRQPARYFLCRRRPEIFGLAEFKPKMLLSRPEIYSKPAWGSTSKVKISPAAPGRFQLLRRSWSQGAERSVHVCTKTKCDNLTLTRPCKEQLQLYFQPIHSFPFILDIYIAPLQETYSEALSVQLRPNRK